LSSIFLTSNRAYVVNGASSPAGPVKFNVNEQAFISVIDTTTDLEVPASTINMNLRSEEHTSELQSPCNLVCRLLLEKKKNHTNPHANRATASTFLATAVAPPSQLSPRILHAGRHGRSVRTPLPAPLLLPVTSSRAAP